MKYTSTRDSNISVTSAQAIAKGISDDGGLFIPERIPKLSHEEFKSIGEMEYIDAAISVLEKFLTDYSREELTDCACGAYSGTFDDDEPAPLVELEKGAFVLELWHGPTCAFKDLALQILPFLLTKASAKVSKALSGSRGRIRPVLRGIRRTVSPRCRRSVSSRMSRRCHRCV